MDKKGQVMGQLGALGVGVASLVIIMAVVFLVLAQVGDQATTLDAGSGEFATCNSTACNATKTLTTAAATIPGWVPLIILVAIGGLILSLVAVFGKR
mgnify:CR=1 FL=1